jgi:8-oxo-dGTP diphosphatase
MAREERAVFTNMCMISDGNGNVLVQDRLNPDWPGITFPGGHVEPGEAFTLSVIREVYEETGLTIENPVLCGTKQFQTKTGARYVVFFYKASRYHGILQSSSEGKVFWLPRTELQNQKLAPDMMEMVRVMESEDLSEFYYQRVEGNWKFTLY